MALKAVVDKLEDVAEEFRSEYEEIEDGDSAGRFRLKVEGADALVDVSGLKGALAKANKKGRLVDAIRKEFPDATDEELTDLVKKAKGLQRESGADPDEDPKNVDKLVKKLRTELEEEYGPIKTENTSLKSKLRRVLLDDQIKAQALKAGVFPEDVEDVLEITRKRFDLNDKDQVVVLDKDGDPSSVTLEKFFADVFKKEKPKFYKAPEASGGDGGGTRRAPSRTEADDLAKLPPAQRLTEARKRGVGKT